MAVHNPVGDVVTFSTSASSAQSSSIAQQSDTLRIVALSQVTHVAIGSTPVAAVTNYVIPSGGTANINLGQPTSTRIVEVIKSSAAGAATTCYMPQGVVGAPFEVGNTVALTSNKSGWAFQHHPISAISVPDPRATDSRTKIEVDFDSSGFSGTWVESDSAAGDEGTLRKTFQLAARTASGSGSLYAQQIQISGDA